MTTQPRWLIGSLLLLTTAACSATPEVVDGGRTDARTDVRTDGGGGVDSSAPRCGPGIDSDMDGINNDEECTLGSDPFNSDSDMDGVRDGVERNYPRICVAADRAMQRRPAPSCTDDTMCNTGERCRGLDPAASDSDGDGVPDSMEDMGLDGMFDTSMGETDPRLWDTDGDGMNDSMGGLDICRPAGLATVTQLTVPMSAIQAGHDPAFGTAREVSGTMGRGALLLDDAAAGVAGVVFALPASGDLRTEQMRIESAITSAAGAGITPVLVGRPITTHEMQMALTSTYRIVRATSASAIRDGLVMPIIGAAATPGAAVGTSGEFFLDVTIVRRTSGAALDRLDVIVTVVPRSDYEDTARPSSARANDLVNTTGIAEAGKVLGNACQVFRAERSAIADFLWTVDTSGSMGDDQVRLANVAVQFVDRLRTAGVDFRVGVLQAGSNVMGPNLMMPGFRWINGSSPTSARELCEQVTDPATDATRPSCPMTPGETLAPYRFAGGQEEPTAAAVIAHNLFRTRGMAGETNPEFRFREGARVVTFHVTDEPGTNDFTRYFDMTSDPGTMTPWGTVYNDTTLNNIVQYFRRNEILTFGLVPQTPRPCTGGGPMMMTFDLPRCVIEGNGGAVIPIATATDSEISAAMARIVDSVAGATSQFRLTRSPITSTIQVRVRGMMVPRSRSQGFDYDPSSRSVVFYGSMFRPLMGDQVVISYRVWEGSLG